VRKHADARILLTTFSETLAGALRVRLRRLLGNEPRLGERVEVHSMLAAARRLYRAHFGGANPKLATRDEIRECIAQAATAVPERTFTPRFLLTEWDDVVDAWQLESWESYRDVPRLGRRTRLPEAQRATLWRIFSGVRAALAAKGVLTEAALFSQLAVRLRPAFDFAVVDEAQDLSIAQIRFLAALGRNRPDALFFAGDLGQRIFQQPFSWKALGVDIRGRSTTLKINYRTSHQIRAQADRLLAPSVSDVDGNTEERKGTTSVFNGPLPVIQGFDSVEAEAADVAGWLAERVTADGMHPNEIGVFRSGQTGHERVLNSALNWWPAGSHESLPKARVRIFRVG
jgi:superfamily I DNA/RNA helicase